MGAADIVPGVSGGTIAFIFGIYEELLYSIKTLSGETLQLALKGKFKEAWESIPFSFLIPVGLGIMTALVTLAKLVSYLLDAYPAELWSFFFGLVIASIFLVKKRVVTWDVKDYVMVLGSAIATYFIVGAVPFETAASYPLLFLSGAIAICAMILPGISGSFLLLIMGKYDQILQAVSDRDIVTIAVVGAGAVVGLALFSRLLSWLFAKHHDTVVAILIGFMIGSLRKIWPWKEVIMTRINSHGEEVPFITKNILPAVDGVLLICLVLMAAGFGLIMYMESLQVTKEQTADLHDPEFEKQHKKALKREKH